MISALNALILFVCTLLVVSILPHFSIFFVVPLLPLFFLIPLTYFKKGSGPILLAALTGAILDLYSGYPFGFFLCYFLFVSLVVRILFQEGMRRLSFWYYLLVLGLSMLAFYGVQALYFMIIKVPLSLGILKSIALGLVTNLLYGILFYAFSSWYFDKTVDLGNYLKRR